MILTAVFSKQIRWYLYDRKNIDSLTNYYKSHKTATPGLKKFVGSRRILQLKFHDRISLSTKSIHTENVLYRPTYWLSKKHNSSKESLIQHGYRNWHMTHGSNFSNF